MQQQMDQEIKLKHDSVISQLSKTKTALEALTLNSPAKAGSNTLDFTSQWMKREEQITGLLKGYIAVVQKSIEDTKAGVDLLKHQDESIIRK